MWLLMVKDENYWLWWITDILLVFSVVMPQSHAIHMDKLDKLSSADNFTAISLQVSVVFLKTKNKW